MPIVDSSAARTHLPIPAGASRTGPWQCACQQAATPPAGIEQNISPGDPISGDGYTQEDATLPVYMPDAVNLFSDSDFIRNSLGPELQRIFTLTKRQELEEFRRRISLLEYQSYLEKL